MSIQRNLVLWLIGGLAVGIVTVLGATYLFAYEELSRVFDSELRKIAQAVHLREDWSTSQGRKLRIARPGFGFSVRAYDADGRIYFETAQPSLPARLAQRYESGFSIMETDEGEWRVYTHVTPEGIVQVGQPEQQRVALAQELSFRMAAPVLILVPLLLGIVAWALKRALAPVKQLSQRVRDRDVNRLDPLPTRPVPQELVPLVEQINLLLERLSESLASQRRFVADAAHELRSPVTALLLQAQVAERTQRPAERAAAFAELRRGIARAIRLVEQLLHLARLEPGVPREAVRPIDLAAVVREVIGMYAARADELGIDLGVEGADSAPLAGAESELRSLVTNLVDNALRYAPRGSEVTVQLHADLRGVEMRVIDGGPGIPDAERDRVFHRFQRVPGDPTRGSGLGLPIVKAIVERHQGSIVLMDAALGEPGEKRGLLVRVRLPAEPPGLKAA
ncbi:MAG: ATP-binding protein [Betaproteobacteria bacterium]